MQGKVWSHLFKMEIDLFLSWMFIVLQNETIHQNQQTFTYSKSTLESLEKGVK